MGRVADSHLLEEPERVGVAQQVLIIESMDQSALGEDAPVRVADPPLELVEILRAELGDLGIAERHEARLDMLGQRPFRDGMMGQPARQVDLADR